MEERTNMNAVGPAKTILRYQVHIELKHPITQGTQRRYYHHLDVEERHSVFRQLDELVVMYDDDGCTMEKRIPYDNVVEYTFRYLPEDEQIELK